MASRYLLVPEERNCGALKYYRQSRCNEPGYCEDANAVYRALHPPVGEKAKVKEQDGDDGKADRDGPADLLDVDRLLKTCQKQYQEICRNSELRVIPLQMRLLCFCQPHFYAFLVHSGSL